jgi:hypothetical protein
LNTEIRESPLVFYQICQLDHTTRLVITYLTRVLLPKKDLVIDIFLELGYELPHNLVVILSPGYLRELNPLFASHNKRARIWECRKRAAVCASGEYLEQSTKWSHKVTERTFKICII